MRYFLIIISAVSVLCGQAYAADYSGTATGEELDFVHGVTSAIQDQLDAKQATLADAVLAAIVEGFDTHTEALTDIVYITDAAGNSYKTTVDDLLSLIAAGHIPVAIARVAAPTFTGLVTTEASDTSEAGLRLPHGAAPSSPTNGDIWTTTAGIYVHINGSTVGPLVSGDLSAYGRTLIDDDDAATARTTLGLVIGTNVLAPDGDGSSLTSVDADTIDLHDSTYFQAAPSEGAFDDGDKTKLDTIETSADVTDATNVEAAGALMDSELAGIANVKALDQSVVSGASPTFNTTNMSDDTNKRFMSDTQESKLDSVENSADVTDATNVAAAGAVMKEVNETDPSDSTWDGRIDSDAVAGESMTSADYGRPLYCKDTGSGTRWYFYDPDATNTDNVDLQPTALLLTAATKSAGDTISVTSGQGTFAHDGWTDSMLDYDNVGYAVFCTSTGVDITAPSGIGDVVKQIGTVVGYTSRHVFRISFDTGFEKNS
jgi:hypothetical protein